MSEEVARCSFDNINGERKFHCFRPYTLSIYYVIYNKKKYRYKQSDFQQHNKEKASEIAKNINLNRANLLELYQLALQSNPTWLAAQADALALKEKVPQALGQLLPNISASGVHNKTNTTQKTTQTYNGKKIHPKNNYVYDSYNYALTGRQAIFRPYNFALYKQAKNEANRADAMIEQALQDRKFIGPKYNKYFNDIKKILKFYGIKL